ncbi:gustatory receptor for sugar taste 43a [Lutzomyia longipalpis]|uniref:gustatory receptor for sugar taste 43a n=1 Tax=Lutzomyia longipalpis TaxID=7200 RepID=UPI002483AB76|nr:gustatory receptor for sugar taste 43a [Lutzomyia longipalpis]XP_055676873.1 gustatory receptor for sugar taste 43a [Lutzomyia longipalpis]XP_055676874.1 gustatory receptor for sugar taste 43a [Lutzomyia longipalpis]XP_055676876.1 gustatory receptor for sugar taste 43a [Lutzomyia longipalpis]XP_055676877.1 gustatory receptor for sugar taste 43a [Lutzomyia longipalpis]
MEISKTTEAIFYVSRVFGLSPYQIIRNAKGHIIDYTEKRIWYIYTILVIVALDILTFYGIHYDMTSKRPVRMKTSTSRVVTVLDISIIVGASTSGVLCGLFGLSRTRKFNHILRTTDEYLSSYSEFVRKKRRGIIFLVATLVTLTVAVVVDIIVWMRAADKLATKTIDTRRNVWHYMTIYLLYYVLVVFHVVFTQSALGIADRFRFLNKVLLNVFPESTLHLFQPIRVIKLPVVQNVSQAVDDLGNKTKNATTAPITTLTGVSTKVPPIKLAEILERLIDIHSSLGQAVHLMSTVYGAAIIVGLISCLLHVVATAYFLLLEILDDGSSGLFCTAQLLWLVVHNARLLMVVEPCHTILSEAMRTTKIVCDIQRYCKDPSIKEKLEIFWSQLVVQKSYFTFSAFGMCKIDREIITSFFGTIATYLVILIQFQRSDTSAPPPIEDK